MRLPEDCKDMAELRVEIDVLDRELITLLAQRVTYIDRAAEIKYRDGIPANTSSRVEEVLSKVRSQSVDCGLSPDLTEIIWREMIAWSIAREETALHAKGK